jgi:hypothetical protein
MKWLLRLWLLAVGLAFLLGLLVIGLILFVISLLKWAVTGRRPNIIMALNSYRRWTRKAPPWAQYRGPAEGEIIDAEAKVVKDGTPTLSATRTKGHDPM